MKRLKVIDGFFLATETQSTPWHMGGCEIFTLPKNAPKTFIDGLVAGMCEQKPVPPFNQKLDTTGLWPRWKTVEVDINYHFSRQKLPSPGTSQQLMSALEQFGASTLDRNAPLWSCCFIEGLEGGRFAIAFKVHHSLVDGQGGLKMILRAMSSRKGDKTARALWGDNVDSGKERSKPRKTSRNKSSRGLSLAGMGSIISAKSAARWFSQMSDMRLFKAKQSPLNSPPASAARRFGIGDLPLDVMIRVAKHNGATINDVLLCVVDAALHRYLDEQGRSTPESMIAAMPVSTRTEGEEGGNAAGLLTIELGQKSVDASTRLAQICKNTQRAKTHLRELPSGLIIGYGLAVLGMPLLLSKLGLSERLPIVNLGVSNVSPPKGSNYLAKPLYLRGAQLAGLYTQPILPPSVLLNVTAASMKGKLCLGIGSTREAIDDPLLFADYIADALAELESIMVRELK